MSVQRTQLGEVSELKRDRASERIRGEVPEAEQ